MKDTGCTCAKLQKWHLTHTDIGCTTHLTCCTLLSSYSGLLVIGSPKTGISYKETLAGQQLLHAATIALINPLVEKPSCGCARMAGLGRGSKTVGGS
jgi:hypothetical protein